MKSFTLHSGAASSFGGSLCDSVAWRLTCGQHKKWCGHGGSMCKRQTLGLRTRRVGSLKGQEVFILFDTTCRPVLDPPSLRCKPPKSYSHHAEVPEMGDRPPTSICCQSQERVAFHTSLSACTLYAVRRHVDDLVCSLLYIALFTHTAYKQTSQLNAITANFRTSNNGQR